MAFSFRVGTSWCHDFPKLARESGFYFNMHRPRVRVDWNRIGNIDIDRVIQERDFSTVDENINNVIDYCWESEYDVKILDTNFVKLFRLSQLAVEYLLYCKQYLDHSVVILKDELRLKIEENVKLKKEMRALEDVIKRLKEKSRDTYKLIDTKIWDSSGEILKCPHCPKTFISALFVNAHIARRHPYISDVQLPLVSPNDHYRVETEKLHEEIKTLKERLNQTERVIRNESYVVPDNSKVDYEKKTTREELENLKYTIEEGEKPVEFKGYQEEINNLKSVLLDEINSLKQKEKSMREIASETNVQMLMNQQEKEFQKLREQVFQKFTPDIESMNVKLRTQEDYWKTKLDHLEQQHRQDIEKLTTELKLTQKAADRTKSEYESKVGDLEKQCMDQSSILQEQSNRLNNLTREINNSQEKSQQLKTTGISAVENIHQSLTPENRDKKNTIEVRSRNSQNLLNDNIIMEDVDSVSSRDSERLVNVIPRTRFFKKSVYTSSTKNNKKDDDYEEETSRRQLTRSKNSGDRTAEEEAEECLRNCKYLDPSNASTNYLRNFQTNRFSSKSAKDVLLSELKSSPKRNPVETFSVDVGNGERRESRKVNDLSSETESEIVTSDSRSDSDSQDAITMTNGTWLQERRSRPDSLSLQKSPVRQVVDNKSTQVDPFQIFEQKLKDLGIDPEWQGIPSVTFKQKMDLVKHHQNISSKKVPKYNQMRAKILNEVLQRLSARYKNKKSSKSEKNSSVVNVRPRITKVLDTQRISESESQFLPKAKAPQPLQRHQNKSDVSNGFDAMSTKPKKPITDFRPTRNAPVYSPTSIDSPKRTNHVNNSGESTIESFLNSLDKSKPLLESPGHKSTPVSNDKNSFISQFLESNDPDNLIARQESMHESLMSPKNRSVLKSTTGSTGSLAKKKRVNFDLEDDKEAPSPLPQEEEITDYPWKTPEFSTEGNALQTENRSSTSNIVLKTSQSDKIAEISRKIEAQLSMARRQPVGAVETMFLSGYMQDKQKENDDDLQVSSSSITSSLLGSPVRETLNSVNSNTSFPQPAPRHLTDRDSNTVQAKRNLSFTDNSDLESDIDEILKA